MLRASCLTLEIRCYEAKIIHIEDCEGWWLSAVVAQWQNTGGSSQRCPGFDSWRLTGLAMMGKSFYWRALCTKPDEESQNALKTLQIKVCLYIYHQR